MGEVVGGRLVCAGCGGGGGLIWAVGDGFWEGAGGLAVVSVSTGRRFGLSAPLSPVPAGGGRRLGRPGYGWLAMPCWARTSSV